MTKPKKRSPALHGDEINPYGMPFRLDPNDTPSESMMKFVAEQLRENRDAFFYLRSATDRLASIGEKQLATLERIASELEARSMRAQNGHGHRDDLAPKENDND